MTEPTEWVMVPRFPTAEMIEAGHSAHPNIYGVGVVPCVVHYRQMIAAAPPSLPSSLGVEVVREPTGRCKNVWHASMASAESVCSECKTVDGFPTVRSSAAHVKFLNEAATYFRNRPTGGEDSAHWANVYNAENFEKAAAKLAEQARTIEGLQNAGKGLEFSHNHYREQAQSLEATVAELRAEIERLKRK